MEDTAGGPGTVTRHNRSAGELAKQLSEQISVLMRDEFRLARLEMTRKGKQAGTGAGMLGGGGLIALYGVGCLIACAILALSLVLRAWLAALIVGVVLLVVAAIVAVAGKARLRQGAPLVPQEAMQSIKADVGEVKERARR